MSVHTEITNPFFKVRKQVKNSHNEWVDQPYKELIQKNASYFNRTISGDGTSIITSFGNPTTIDIFEFTTVKESSIVLPLLYIDPRYNGNYDSIFHVVSKTGRVNPTPSMIETHGHSFLDVDTDNEGNSKVFLKKPIYIPQGCRLVLRGFNNEDTKTTYNVFWTEEVEK